MSDDGMPVMGDEPDDLDAFIAEQGDDFRHELALAELRAEVARLTAERDELRRQAAIGAWVQDHDAIRVWNGFRYTSGDLDHYRRAALAAGAPVSGDQT